MSSSYAEKLKEIREAEGLTQVQLSKEIDIPVGTIRNYETGFREVGLSVISKFTNHSRFKKYTTWLMNGETNEAAGQISPTLSPDGQAGTSRHRSEMKAG